MADFSLFYFSHTLFGRFTFCRVAMIAEGFVSNIETLPYI